MNYLSILFVSAPILGANNRGEGSGNLQTLQKVTTRSGTRTVLSGPSIRRAMRDSMQATGAKMWRRTVDPSPKNPAGYVYGDNDSPTMKGAKPSTPEGFADQVFGWMIAAKGEAKDEGKDVNKKRSAIGVSSAISMTPYDGDMSFVQGLKAAAPQLNPFQVERHWTRYQFIMTMNLDCMGDSTHAVLDTLKGLQVGGSHAGNLTELTPEVIAWRFHDVPGQSGLYLGAGINILPDGQVDMTPLKVRAKNLGFDFHIAGIGMDSTVAEAIKAIKAEV